MLKKTYTSKEIMQMLKKDGWKLDRIRGSHHQFKHPTKTATVTLQHPVTDLSLFVVKSIFKQAGWE